jgi:hypothetical protein
MGKKRAKEDRKVDVAEEPSQTLQEILKEELADEESKVTE